MKIFDQIFTAGKYEQWSQNLAEKKTTVEIHDTYWQCFVLLFFLEVPLCYI